MPILSVFISVCGIICDIKPGALKDDLIRERCLLKSNFILVKEAANKNDR